MSNVTNLAEWAAENNKPHGFGSNNESAITGPNQAMSPEHSRRGFPSRRAYFWQMSQDYGIHVDEIERKAIQLGSKEDFRMLLVWLRRNDTRRNS